jgi:hypothetical protein
MTDEDVGADFAHPARVYDYWLGGTDNFPADRAAAEQVMRFMPEILDTVRGNRRFLVRAVGFLRDGGIRQFIDIGSGLPNSPNVHEVARAGETGARVMYVDNDPLVFSRASPLTAADGVTSREQRRRPHPARPGRSPAHVQRARAGRTGACPGLLLAA